MNSDSSQIKKWKFLLSFMRRLPCSRWVLVFLLPHTECHALFVFLEGSFTWSWQGFGEWAVTAGTRWASHVLERRRTYIGDTVSDFVWYFCQNAKREGYFRPCACWKIAFQSHINLRFLKKQHRPFGLKLGFFCGF